MIQLQLHQLLLNQKLHIHQEILQLLLSKMYQNLLLDLKNLLLPFKTPGMR